MNAPSPTPPTGQPPSGGGQPPPPPGSNPVPTPAPAPTPATGNTAGITAVNHIIFLAEENRGFLHYFGKLNDYRRAQGLGADVVYGIPDDCMSSNSDWTVPCSLMNKSPDANGVPTTPIYSFHLKTQCIDDLSPDWIVSHWDFNAEDPSSNTPMMDGFVISAASAALADNKPDTAGIRAMGFYTADDLEYHYWLATQFATSDTWFSPVPSRTPPNRYYMYAATSGGYAYPVGATEPSIKSKTIFDSLTAAGISWKIYTESGFTYGSFFSNFSSRYKNTGNIVIDPNFAQFISDAKNGNLPQVVYIEKPDDDEKPISLTSIQIGVAESQKLINAVMYGASWKDSVMIITFDEDGGTFDYLSPPTNVPSPDGIQPVDICTNASDTRCAFAALSHPAPPYDATGDFTRYGFRVPLMVVSPFTKPHYVSHLTTDYTAWIKFVETRFNLAPLNNRDGWADTSDMTDFFDFQNPALMTPPQNPPAVKTGGPCTESLP